MEKLFLEMQDQVGDIRCDKQVIHAKTILKEYSQNRKVLALKDQDHKVIASCVLSRGKNNSKYRHTIFIEDLFISGSVKDIVPFALYAAFREGRKWGLKSYVLGTPFFSMKQIDLEALKE